MATPSKKEQKERKQRQQNTLKVASLLRWQAIGLALISFLLYAQTLGFGLVMDDNMVITDHSVVQQGVKGIGTLLTKDSFFGFDEFYDRSSQRKTYRPVSFVSFAIEKQLWNNNPAMGHFVNVALYVCAVLLVFMLFRRLFAVQIIEKNFAEKNFTWLPFSLALLFAVHPVHTSVVVNIKSRDELFALLFGVASAVWLFEYLRSEKLQHWLVSLAAFALALLSKESAVLLLPVIVFLLPYTFSTVSVRKILLAGAPFLALTLVFLAVWFGVVGRVEEGLFAYILHNPFAGASLEERIATGFLLLGMYTLKAIFPWTLSEGYTYNQIPLTSFGDIRAIAAMVLVVGLVGVSIVRLGRSHPLWQRVCACAVLAFFCTLILASNLFVYAGSMLGERFLLTPSLFAVLGLGYSVFVLLGAESPRFRQSIALGVLLLLASGYALRGLMRLPDWASDEKLLRADHRSTPQSMMTARNYASQLILRAGRAKNPTEQSILLDEAEIVISRALAIDSTADASLYDLQALCALQRKDFDRAFAAEERAMMLDSTTRRAIHRKPIFRNNLASAFVSRAARRINAENADSTRAGIQDLRAALQLNPQSETAYLNLGMIFGKQQQLDSALAYFQAAYRVNPQSELAQRYIYAIQQAKLEEQGKAEQQQSQGTVPPAGF